MYIDENDIKISHKRLGDGSYGDVLLAKYNKQNMRIKCLMRNDIL